MATAPRRQTPESWQRSWGRALADALESCGGQQLCGLCKLTCGLFPGSSAPWVPSRFCQVAQVPPLAPALRACPRLPACGHWPLEQGQARELWPGNMLTLSPSTGPGGLPAHASLPGSVGREAGDPMGTGKCRGRGGRAASARPRCSRARLARRVVGYRFSAAEGVVSQLLAFEALCAAAAAWCWPVSSHIVWRQQQGGAGPPRPRLRPESPQPSRQPHLAGAGCCPRGPWGGPSQDSALGHPGGRAHWGVQRRALAAEHGVRHPWSVGARSQ